MDPLSAASKIAGSGLEVQSTRLRIVSENIANARSTGDTPAPTPIAARPSLSVPSSTASAAWSA